jgi:hypothetical protein
MSEPPGVPVRSPSALPGPHHFVTVDAESAVIAEGIRVISAIRERVEQDQGIEIPIVWFVRFQRSWTEYVTIDSPEYFSATVGEVFDGFELAASELDRLRGRDDEIGWHYHAYSYVHRDDLSHPQKVAILHADLRACATEIRRRHAGSAPQSVRFGWFFIPDYDLFSTLSAVGIRVDASVRATDAGRNVAMFKSRYLPPITRSARKVNEIWFVPHDQTSIIHDWTVLPHQFSWRSQDDREAARERDQFEMHLRRTARQLKGAGGAFLTYERMLAAVEPEQ